MPGSHPVRNRALIAAYALILLVFGLPMSATARTAPEKSCDAGLQAVVTTRHVVCTHGPDATPPGLDIHRPVAPLAASLTASALPVCEGDGVSGKRVEVLYIHGSTSRYAQYLETFRTLAEGVDAIYNASAAETGGERHVR
ncbi:hypothetical protein HDA40_007678 [Hamadaea flava]|uniref:Uncharacterized protein n=1 Tax=Hamadaea flava TaxID=1742688 RepID=A0ABV8LXR9_9ACTN|nr:hypothetical protein [Hamadaea flava]MCP2329171.1 hypothetical protein [Hamadaea flava]